MNLSGRNLTAEAERGKTVIAVGVLDTVNRHRRAQATY